MLEAATGALLSTDTQRGLEWQPTVPTRATREADAWDMHAAAAAVHGAWLAPTAHCILVSGRRTSGTLDSAAPRRWPVAPTRLPAACDQLPEHAVHEHRSRPLVDLERR